MENSKLSWSVLYKYRRVVRGMYKTVYKIPVKKKLLSIVDGELSGSESVLDVGASDRALGDKVLKLYPDATYKTMDLDKEASHDYYSLDDIEESFDIIVLAEVIEHIELEEGVEFLRKLNGLLKPGGKIIVTTPNIHHPNIWMRDADHKVPYRYDVLGSVLMETGFEVDKIFRIYNDKFVRRFIRLYVTSFIHRYFDIDFAKNIVIVAQKK